MRKITFIIFVCLIMISSNVSAKMRSISVTDINKIVGEWYDSKGNLALTIGSDYTINGCKVVAAYNYDFDDNHKVYIPSMAIFDQVYKIAENNTYRNIEIGHYARGYYEFIAVDGKHVYFKSKELKHFESIGGIYLGMDKEQVIKLYGEPSQKITKYGITNWKYEQSGFEVNFLEKENFVEGIKIYKNSDRKFDWSGLSANNSISDFENKYNAKYDRSGRFGMNIGGNGYKGISENIRIDEKNGSVTLGLRIH